MSYYVLMTYDVKKGSHNDIRNHLEEEEGWEYLGLTTSFATYFDGAKSRSSAMRLTRESLKRTMKACNAKVEAAFLVSAEGGVTQDLFE